MIALLGTDFVPRNTGKPTIPFRANGCELDDVSRLRLVDQRRNAARDEKHVLDRLEGRMQYLPEHELHGLEVWTDDLELMARQLGE